MDSEYFEIYVTKEPYPFFSPLSRIHSLPLQGKGGLLLLAKVGMGFNIKLYLKGFFYKAIENEIKLNLPRYSSSG